MAPSVPAGPRSSSPCSGLDRPGHWPSAHGLHPWAGLAWPGLASAAPSEQHPSTARPGASRAASPSLALPLALRRPPLSPDSSSLGSHSPAALPVSVSLCLSVSLSLSVSSCLSLASVSLSLPLSLSPRLLPWVCRAPLLGEPWALSLRLASEHRQHLADPWRRDLFLIRRQPQW